MSAEGAHQVTFLAAARRQLMGIRTARTSWNFPGNLGIAREALLRKFSCNVPVVEKYSEDYISVMLYDETF